ncbi:MAG: hypothetical protein V4555_21530 [Acidobacteriota bacterium]
MPRPGACLLRHLSPLTSIVSLSFLLLATATLSAQTPQAAPGALATPADQPGQPYTLHVYKRVVQVPTLVLTQDHKQYAKPIDAARFTVSLDSGPRFHPTRIRLEGDDPISLSILLDVGGSQRDLLPALERNLAAWVSRSLKPQDRVSIYAVDCNLIRTAQQLPPDPQLLTRQLHAALISTATHRNRPHPACGNAVPLWSSLITIMASQVDHPGRRVILGFTIGYNGASSLYWTDVRSAAARTGISIYAFAQRAFIDISPAEARDREVFSELCQSSGGLTEPIDPLELPKALDNFTTMLRNRYILEFPVPFNPTSGSHSIRVDIAHLDAFIQPAGVDVALTDPALAKDPSTIPTDESAAPKMGKHRPH